MEVNKILQADVLDIIFEGRNKDYGAYQLRKTYDRRLRNALIGTASVVALLCAGWLIRGMHKGGTKIALIGPDVTLEVFPPDKKIEMPPAVKIEKPPVQTVKFNVPKIVKEDVKQDERPPEIKEIENSKIGNINVAGDIDKDIVAPPGIDGKGVIEAPKDNADYDNGIFIGVQVQSEYPGGIAAWMRYLSKNLQYPDQAIQDNIQGDVLVQFVVDKEGNVSDVQALSGPDELRDEAIRVIKKSGKWTVAIQNGHQVKSYKKQPIKFRLASEN
ncbi:MAG: energy transducer TonB [Bacteroidetes bacterium]|nr:energy transducer TonB [Bacteroidota bacterium]